MFNHLINLAKESHFNRYNTNEVEDENDSHEKSNEKSKEKPNDSQNQNQNQNLFINQVYECFDNKQ